MAETVDVQAVTIGVGTLIAIALLGYGTLVGETIAGVDATTAAAWVLAATFAAVALLHGAWGRFDLAGAHALAATGWVLVLVGANPLQVVGGLLSLLVGGSYVALASIRARNGEGA